MKLKLKVMEAKSFKKLTKKKKKKILSVCLSSIPFWDVPKYYPISKSKSY